MITLKQIQELPVGEFAEVAWVSNWNVNGSAHNVGKIHLAAAETVPYTLCGVLIGKPSRQYHPYPADPRCQRCQRRAAK